jgi:hypothetical protein
MLAGLWHYKFYTVEVYGKKQFIELVYQLYLYVNRSICYLKFLLLCRRKKEELGEPEADPERDQRTVFAYQVSFNLKINATIHALLQAS